MKTLLRKKSFWLATGLVAVFGFRAVTGIVGGIAYIRGATFAADGYYLKALPMLEKASVGEVGFEAVWLSAEVRQGMWDLLRRGGDPGEEGMELLRQAASDYTRAASISPASGWPWAGLGSLHGRLEEYRRSLRTYDIGELGGSPWSMLGRDGRIGLGMLRKAAELEPNVHIYRDMLVEQLVRNELQKDALLAIAETARVQPRFEHHDHFDYIDMTNEMLEEFARVSVESLGHAPLLKRERHLFSLGKLFRRLEKYDQAESYLRQALEEPATSLRRAEVAYHLASVLIDQGMYDEAAVFLERAKIEPAFKASSLALQSRIAMEREKPEEAVALLRQCWQIDPRNLGYCLRFSRLARQLQMWDEAEEALNWSVIVHPGNVIPLLELVRTYLDRGDIVNANMTLEKARFVGGDTPEVIRLQAEIDGRNQNPGFL